MFFFASLLLLSAIFYDNAESIQWKRNAGKISHLGSINLRFWKDGTAHQTFIVVLRDDVVGIASHNNISSYGTIEFRYDLINGMAIDLPQLHLDHVMVPDLTFVLTADAT